MQPGNHIKKLFVFVNEDGKHHYVKFGSYGEPSVVLNFDQASDQRGVDIETIARRYSRLCQEKEKFTGATLHYMNVSLEVKTENIPVDEGEILEQRQIAALKKLREDDIEALDVTSIATYIKLKYHNGKK